MPKPIVILNGPNLNMLGTREPEIYGTTTLADIEALCHNAAATHGLTVHCKQSNHEGELIDWIQDAAKNASGIIINAGGYTHTSIAIHDALRAVALPVIEVHVSDPKSREPFRHHSYIELVAQQTISGLGGQSYVLALKAMAKCVGGE